MSTLFSETSDEESSAYNFVLIYPPVHLGVSRDTRAQAWVRLGDLFLDGATQRGLREEKWRPIADSPDWNKFETPTTTLRRDPDGVYRLYVDEGQHRTYAFQQVFPPDTLILVNITAGLTRSGEADLAREIDRSRTKMDPYDKWHLDIQRGELFEILGQRVLVEHKLRLGRWPASRTIGCTGTIANIVHKSRNPEKGADLLDSVLWVIETAFPDRGVNDELLARWDSVMLSAVAKLIVENPQIKLSRLAEKLKKLEAVEWVTTSKKQAYSRATNVAVGVAIRYNSNLRMDRLSVRGPKGEDLVR